MASLTLKCIICPKKPDFSDLSHLLTHLSSKGHLSHYFRAQVKSRTEPAAAANLAEYDGWYQDNDVERLLSERMMQKEKRTSANTKGNAESRKPLQDVSNIRSARQRIIKQGLPISQADEMDEDELIDPQLSRQSSLAPQPRTKRGSTTAPPAQKTRRPYNRGGKKRLQTIEPDGPRQSPTRTHRRGKSIRNTDLGNSCEGIHASNSHQRPHDTRRVTSLVPSLSRGSTEALNEDTDVEDAETESTADCVLLKGMVWPGMDLFDSASPHAKRIRNQRKDRSALTEMAAYAETITPNEAIYFYPSWELKKSREITGQVESSSPEKNSEPPFPVRKTRKTRGRAPLAPMNENARMGRKQTKKTIGTKENEKDEADLVLEHALASYQTSEMQHGMTLWPQSFQATGEDDSMEWSLTFGQNYTRRKRTTDVFRDTDESQRRPQTRPYRDQVTQDRLLQQETPCPRTSSISANRDVARTRQAHVPLQALQQHLGYSSSCTLPSTDLIRAESNKENIPHPMFAAHTNHPSLRPTQSRMPERNQLYFRTEQLSDPHSHSQPQVQRHYQNSMPPCMDFFNMYNAHSPLNDRSSINPLTFNFEQTFAGSPVRQGMGRTTGGGLQDPVSPNPLLDFTTLIDMSGGETADGDRGQNRRLPKDSDDETIDDAMQDLRSRTKSPRERWAQSA